MHNENKQCEHRCIPTIFPTPTKKPKECGEEYRYWCPPVTPTVTIAVTPTPEVEPSITPEISITHVVDDSVTLQAGASAQQASAPSVPVCTIPIDAPLLQGFEKTSDTSVFWKWWPSKSHIVSQWLEYGYEKGNYPYSVSVPVAATGYEVGSLQPGLVRWARVGIMDNQGCVAYSNDLDP